MTARLHPDDIGAIAAAVAERDCPPALVDAKSAADMLGVPSSWVLAEARANRIPHTRLGRYVRFDPVALRAWAGEQERGPGVRS